MKCVNKFKSLIMTDGLVKGKRRREQGVKHDKTHMTEGRGEKTKTTIIRKAED